MSDKPEWCRKREYPFLRFFEEIEKMIAGNLSEESVKERELPDGSKIRVFGPLTYGYSMKIGPDGQAEIKEFGNIRPPRPPNPFDPKPDIPFPNGKQIPKEREPLTDIYTRNNEVKVIVEIPNVKESDITVQSTSTSLIILVNNEKRKEIELPAKVDPNSHKYTYRNNILEVTLREQKPQKEDSQSK